MLTHFDSNWASHHYQGHRHSHTSAVKKVELANEFNIFPICSDCWRRLEFSESRASAKLQMWYLLQQLWRWQIIKQANKQKNKRTNSDSWTGENVIFSATLMKKRFVWHKLCPFPNRTIKLNKAKKQTNKQTNKQKGSHGPVQNYKCYYPRFSCDDLTRMLFS